jgi:hypothetical protein
VWSVQLHGTSVSTASDLYPIVNELLTVHVSTLELSSVPFKASEALASTPYRPSWYRLWFHQRNTRLTSQSSPPHSFFRVPSVQFLGARSPTIPHGVGSFTSSQSSFVAPSIKTISSLIYRSKWSRGGTCRCPSCFLDPIQLSLRRNK